MTPRAKLAKRITTKKQEPKQVANQATNERGVPYWEIFDRQSGNAIHTFLADTEADAKTDTKNWLTGISAEQPELFDVRPKMSDESTDKQATLQNTERGEWEFYRTETGNVIDRVNDASRMQANAVRADIVRRYGHPDASVGMRRVDQQGVQDVEPDVAQNFSQPTTYEIYRRNAGNPTAIHRFQAATHPEAMAELERFRQSHPETAPYELSLRNVPA